MKSSLHVSPIRNLKPVARRRVVFFFWGKREGWRGKAEGLEILFWGWVAMCPGLGVALRTMGRFFDVRRVC